MSFVREPRLQRAATPRARADWSAEDHGRFATRDLDDVRPLVLFVGGVPERWLSRARRPALLCAWAIGRTGRRELVALAGGTRSSAARCRELLGDLVARGLRGPIVLVTDGVSALSREAQRAFPDALHQICLAQQERSLACRLSDAAREDVLGAMKDAHEARSSDEARSLARAVAARHGASHRSAVASFLETFEACVARLRLPASLRCVARTTHVDAWMLLAERALDAAGVPATVEATCGELARVIERDFAVPVEATDLREMDSLAS